MNAHASIEIKILMDSGFFEHNLKPIVSSLNFVWAFHFFGFQFSSNYLFS